MGAAARRAGGGSGLPRFQRWVPVGPRRGQLHLAGHPDEQVLPAAGRDELHAHGQAAGRPVQRRLTAGWPVALNCEV